MDNNTTSNSNTNNSMPTTTTNDNTVASSTTQPPLPPVVPPPANYSSSSSTQSTSLATSSAENSSSGSSPTGGGSSAPPPPPPPAQPPQIPLPLLLSKPTTLNYHTNPYHHHHHHHPPLPADCLMAGQQQLIDQLMIQQQQQTLARHFQHHHPMFASAADPHHHNPHLHHLLAENNKYTGSNGNSHRFVNTNNNQSSASSAQYVDLGGVVQTASSADPATTTTTTAFLVQTPNGSALLIPPPFLSANASLSRSHHAAAAAATGTNAPSTMNPYGITTIPLNHSPSINVNLARPDSTTSANVYQTIDAENEIDYSKAMIWSTPSVSTNSIVYSAASKAVSFNNRNGYLYPTESFYETTALTPTSNNNFATRHNKSSKKLQQHQQPSIQFQVQQQPQTVNGQFMKLIESSSASSSSSAASSTNTGNNNSHKSSSSSTSSSSSSNNNSTNLTGTLHSNTNNSNTNHTTTTATNSNFFVSPALSSAASNNNRRRFAAGSHLERLKFRLTQRVPAAASSWCCSWKCLAIFFLVLTINLLSFTVYLSIMRMYNLNWHLKENQATATSSRHQLISERRLTNSIQFAKIGETVEEKTAAAYDFFNLQFYLDSPAYVKFNLTLERNSRAGVYIDKNSPPTFTKFKIFESFDGQTLVTKPSRKINLKYDQSISTTAAATTNDMVNTGFVHYLDEGLWYLSLFNDNKMPLKFRLRTDFYDYENNNNCPMNCNGKGDCVNGKCKCYPGFSGLDCSSSSCPVLCSGHGRYENGRCVCELDWHGSECHIPIDRCESSDCSGNGECMNGICMCYSGFGGKTCELRACRVENCSNNGVCVNGECRCFHNYTGSDCSLLELAQTNSLSSSICSGHGEFDYSSRRCACSLGWTGPDCSLNANCLDKSCAQCRNGYAGLFCLDRVPLQCDSRCNEHGVCVNGTCTCSPGFHGRHCDINSCPKSCSSNGQCEKLASGRYQCVCAKGWTGVACETAIEMVCNDNVDNDGDGLVDCADSECCVFDNCKLSLACTSSPEPKDRLLRKQPPSLSATFFEKMKFLIEDDSVQTFAYPTSFLESQVAIIRGQVLFKNGQPLIGVKVSAVASPSYGYTLTRNNGIFDLMVNGGGSVELEFTRSRLRTRIVSVSTAWNQFSHIDPVVMYLAEDNDSDAEITDNDSSEVIQSSCEVNEEFELKPVVQSTTSSTIRAAHYPHQAYPISPDSGVLYSTLALPDTDLKLVYTSSQSSGFQSTLLVLLTPTEASLVPDSLRQVHLRIEVEGVVHRLKFDAQSGLRYEFAWDRRNAYEQRVYGSTTAKVRVGYEYESVCGDGTYGSVVIRWESVVVKLAGYDLGSSEIGSWNVDVHHRLNVQQGILHRGDGTSIQVKEMQKLVEIVAGKLKLKRDIDCTDCLLVDESSSASSSDLKFYSPYAATVNRDGFIFLADFNYIWLLNSTEPARPVLELRKDQPYKYYIANEPLRGNLFVSDPINRQIVSLKSLDPLSLLSDLKTNARPVESLCWSSAKCDLTRPMSSVVNPKGVAFDSNGHTMYFVDQTEIKSVRTSGGKQQQQQQRVITTIISGQDEWRRPSAEECERRRWRADEMRMRWPTALAVNPIDNSLYVLDDGDAVYKITLVGARRMVELVAGRPAGCVRDTKSSTNELNRVIDMAFAPDGDLFVLENDQQHRQVRVIKSNRQIETYFPDGGQKGIDLDGGVKFAGFNDPISIAVHPNRSVYVLDRGDNVLYHVKPALLRDDDLGKYTIVVPPTDSQQGGEVYVFNRFGLHMHTLDLKTGATLYNFTYNGNALYGKLTSISDSTRTLLVIKRDFHGRAESMQTASGLTMKLKLNNLDMLRSVTTSENNNNRSHVFNYMGNVGLLISRTDHDLNNAETSTVFNYEKSGKVKEIIEPNKKSTNITYSIDSNGLVTTLSTSNIDGQQVIQQQTWLVNSTTTAMTLLNENSRQMETRVVDVDRAYEGVRSVSSDEQLEVYRRRLQQQQQASVPLVKSGKRGGGGGSKHRNSHVDGGGSRSSSNRKLMINKLA